MPPKEHRFKKGQPSANPAGRPKHALFDQAARAILSEVDSKLQKSGAERLVGQMFRRALQGSFKHAELLLGYAMGRPVAQNLNLNADVNAKQITEEQADGIVKQFCDAMGVPEPAWGLAGPQMNVEAVQARVNELLAKREKKKAPPKPPPLLTEGSDSIQ